MDQRAVQTLPELSCPFFLSLSRSLPAQCFRTKSLSLPPSLSIGLSPHVALSMLLMRGGATPLRFAGQLRRSGLWRGRWPEAPRGPGAPVEPFPRPPPPGAPRPRRRPEGAERAARSEARRRGGRGQRGAPRLERRPRPPPGLASRPAAAGSDRLRQRAGDSGEACGAWLPRMRTAWRAAAEAQLVPALCPPATARCPFCPLIPPQPLLRRAQPVGGGWAMGLAVHGRRLEAVVQGRAATLGRSPGGALRSPSRRCRRTPRPLSLSLDAPRAWHTSYQRRLWTLSRLCCGGGLRGAQPVSRF